MKGLLKQIAEAVKAGQTITFRERPFSKSKTLLEVRISKPFKDEFREHTWVFEWDHLEQCYSPEEVVSERIKEISREL